jgi:hypothetical protein
VREAARENDGIGTLEAGLLVPDELRILSEDVFRRVIGVVIAIRSRKDDDSKAHDQASTSMR